MSIHPTVINEPSHEESELAAGDIFGRQLSVKEARVVAHEIDHPLMAMTINAASCLRWLSRDEPDIDQARRAVARIIGNGNRAVELLKAVQSLLPEATPIFSEVDLNDLIRSCLEGMKQELQRLDVTLTTAFEPALAPVLGDRDQIEQVIAILLKNSLEALIPVHDRERILHVSTEMDGRRQVLGVVMDTGIGLDPVAVDRIFDPLYTTKGGGLGLGLPIACSILEAHGGRLWAIAHSTSGTSFRFVLPQSGEQTRGDL